MTWAGLLVAVLYSPVGSPNLYAPVNYNTVNQGIAFTSAEVRNAPIIQSANSGSNVQSLSMPSYNTTTGNGYASASGNYSNQGSKSSMGGGVNLGFSQNKGLGGIDGSAYGSGLSMISGRSSNKGDNGSSSQAEGLISMSISPIDGNNGSMTKQSSNTYLTSGSGGTDPGDNPDGGPIPVGDGWIFLLILVSVYTIWKRNRV